MCGFRDGRVPGGGAGGAQVSGDFPGGGPAAGVASPVPDPAGGLLLDLEFTGGLLYVVRQSVAAHAAAAGMSEARVRDVVIVVHELAANAVRHGAGRGRLRMWSEGGAVRCQ